jgi:hypothetical protein
MSAAEAGAVMSAVETAMAPKSPQIFICPNSLEGIAPAVTAVRVAFE